MATESTNTQATTPEEEKVVFDARQQAKIEEIIKDRMGRAGREAKEEAAQLAHEVENLKAQLAEAQKAAKSAGSAVERGEAKGDVDALKRQIEEAKSIAQTAREEAERIKQMAKEKEREAAEARKETQSLRKNHALTAAADRHGFVNTGLVMKDTQDSVKWDEQRNRFIVVNPETGTERMNSAFELMTLDEFYQEYAAKNPYLVRSDMRGGSGSSEATKTLTNNGKYTLDQLFGPKSDSRLANELALRDRDEYRKMKKQAIEAGLLR